MPASCFLHVPWAHYKGSRGRYLAEGKRIKRRDELQEIIHVLKARRKDKDEEEEEEEEKEEDVTCVQLIESPEYCDLRF